MGRRKIEIQPITHERNRSVTFLKRKNGLFKKAYELGVLCSVDVAVIIFEERPGHHVKLYQYCSSDIHDVVQRHLRHDGEKDTRGPVDFSGNPSSKANDMGDGDEDDVDDDDDDLPPRMHKRPRDEKLKPPPDMVTGIDAYPTPTHRGLSIPQPPSHMHGLGPTSGGGGGLPISDSRLSGGMRDSKRARMHGGGGGGHGMSLSHGNNHSRSPSDDPASSHYPYHSHSSSHSHTPSGGPFSGRGGGGGGYGHSGHGGHGQHHQQQQQPYPPFFPSHTSPPSGFMPLSSSSSRGSAGGGGGGGGGGSAGFAGLPQRTSSGSGSYDGSMYGGMMGGGGARGGGGGGGGDLFAPFMDPEERHPPPPQHQSFGLDWPVHSTGPGSGGPSASSSVSNPSSASGTTDPSSNAQPNSAGNWLDFLSGNTTNPANPAAAARESMSWERGGPPPSSAQPPPSATSGPGGGSPMGLGVGGLGGKRSPPGPGMMGLGMNGSGGGDGGMKKDPLG